MLPKPGRSALLKLCFLGFLVLLTGQQILHHIKLAPGLFDDAGGPFGAALRECTLLLSPPLHLPAP